MEARDESEPVREDRRLMRGEATRERVLDAAERLFADEGFDAVSIRQIAQEAGVTLGVVGFHGGAKLDLFRTILARRVATLTAERTRALDALRPARLRPRCMTWWTPISGRTSTSPRGATPSGRLTPG